MLCPFCSATETKVIDSRLVGEGDKIRRRRECLDCSERFTTYESAELNFPRIIKSDGRRQKFVEEKLRSSFLRALEKRPVPMEMVEIAISHVSHKLRALGLREVKSRKLGEWAMEELRKAGEHEAAADLRSTVIGAQWPEARLAAAGLSKTDRRQRCLVD